jgi:hypothetical protein
MKMFRNFATSVGIALTLSAGSLPALARSELGPTTPGASLTTSPSSPNGCGYGTVMGSGFFLYTPSAPQNIGYGMTGQSAVNVSSDICGDYLTARLKSDNQGMTEVDLNDVTSGYYSTFATKNTTLAGYFHMESRYSYFVYDGSFYLDSRTTYGPTCYSGYAYPDGCASF